MIVEPRPRALRINNHGNNAILNVHTNGFAGEVAALERPSDSSMSRLINYSFYVGASGISRAYLAMHSPPINAMLLTEYVGISADNVEWSDKCNLVLRSRRSKHRRQ